MDDKQCSGRKPSGGIVPEKNIHSVPNNFDDSIRERFLRLNDLSSTVSDVLDHLGIVGCVGASELRPSLSDKRIVGRAITVRNVPQKRAPALNAAEELSLMNELEGVNQADPGDVLVIQGLPNISNMGGMVSTICQRQGLLGAVVDGGVRDLGRSRSIGFPVWSAHISPITGKYRCKTEEINGTIRIFGISVNAGDLVVADETGVCFVPCDMVEKVLEECEAIHAVEKNSEQDFTDGLSVAGIMKKLYKQLHTA